MRRRRTYDPAFRASVALETIKNMQTLAEISREYKVHPNMIIEWKKEATISCKKSNTLPVSIKGLALL